MFFGLIIGDVFWVCVCCMIGLVMFVFGFVAVGYLFFVM